MDSIEFIYKAKEVTANILRNNFFESSNPYASTGSPLISLKIFINSFPVIVSF